MNKFREKLNSHKELEIILPVIIILIIALPLSYNNNQTKQNSSSGNNSQRRTPEQVVTTPTPTPTTTPDVDEDDTYKPPREFGEFLEWTDTVDYTYKNNITDFDLFFLKEENEEKNKVYSPLSVRYALSMLSDGTNGNTKEQIDKVLGDKILKNYNSNSNMSFANAFFVRDTYKDSIKNKYAKLLVDKYSADIITESFSSADPINKWVSDKTFNMVNDLLDNDTVSKEDFILINSLAVDMAWVNQIHCVAGTEDIVACYKSYDVTYLNEKIGDEDWEFNDHTYAYTGWERRGTYPTIEFNGIKDVMVSDIRANYNRYDIIKELGYDNIYKEVEKAYREYLSENGCIDRTECTSEEKIKEYLTHYMEQLASNYGKSGNSTDFLLYDDQNTIAFGKYLQKYGDTRLLYVGIMPKEESLKSFINNTNATKINEIVSNLKTLKIENFKEGVATIIYGEIPFFNYEYELNLVDDLKKLGITDVFDPNKADLSEMVESEGAFIDEAAQKTKIEFTNFGIKAATETYGGGAGNTKGGFEYYFKIPTEHIILKFNKPYMYLLFDVDTGEVWFTGTVYNPEVKK